MEDELAVLRRIEHLTKRVVPDRETLDVLHEAIHERLSSEAPHSVHTRGVVALVA